MKTSKNLTAADPGEDLEQRALLAAGGVQPAGPWGTAGQFLAKQKAVL